MMKNLLDLRKSISRRLRRTLQELAQNLDRRAPVPIPVRVPIPVGPPIRGSRFHHRSLHTFPGYSARYQQVPRIHQFLSFYGRLRASFPQFSLKSQRFQSFYRHKLLASNRYFSVSSKNYLIYSLQHPAGGARRSRRFGAVAQDLVGEKQFGVLEALVLGDASNSFNPLSSHYEPMGCYLEVSLNMAVGLSIPQTGFLNANALQEIVLNLRYVIGKLEALIKDLESIAELGELPIKYDAAARKIYVFFWNRTQAELESLIDDKNLNNFVTVAPLDADATDTWSAAESVSSTDLLSSLSQSFDEQSDMFSSSDDSESFKLDPISVSEPPIH